MSSSAVTTSCERNPSVPTAAFWAVTMGLLWILGTGACAKDRGAAGPRAVYMPAQADLPFSPAVRVGKMIYLSGQIATTLATPRAVVAGGIEPETRQVMENIKEVLEKNGASMDDVVKCTVMLADIREWPAMNSVYTTYFSKNKPARSAFAASGLALGARVEIECWALAPKS
jgi:2-iminobutanoate/2-iminopropanoate deaminase